MSESGISKPTKIEQFFLKIMDFLTAFLIFKDCFDIENDPEVNLP
jgi:hypothetical protein